MKNTHALATLSSAGDESSAVIDTIRQLRTKSAALPVRGGILYTTIEHDTAKLRAALSDQLPGVPFVGTTSFKGVGASPAHFGTGRALAALWLLGDDVLFGTALLDKNGGDATLIGKELADLALEKGGFPSDRASFAVMHPTPGNEEALLTGMYQTLDKNKTPVIGGSAADNDLSGHWSSFTQDKVTTNGVALALCNWPGRIAVAYQSGYLAEGKRGLVTAAEGRKLISIDGRPAAEVYNEWLKGKLSSFLTRGGSVLAETTLKPLGVPYKVGSFEAFVLRHPANVIAEDRSLELFANVSEGQAVALMTSQPTALVLRGANVARTALTLGKLTTDQLAAALMVYCAGCIGAISDRVPEMLESLHGAIGDTPYASVFTFGEQGCVAPGRVDHGNLMACVLLLAKP